MTLDDTMRRDRAVSVWPHRRPAAPGQGRRGLYARSTRRRSTLRDPGLAAPRVAAETIRDWLSAYRAGRLRRAAAASPERPGQARAIPQEIADLLCQLKEETPALSVKALIEQVRTPERTGRSVAGSRHRAPAARAARAHEEAARRADEQGPPPLRLRERRRAVDERRDARAVGRRRRRPQAQELPHRASRRRDPRRAVRRLLPLGEHHRVSARPEAGHAASRASRSGSTSTTARPSARSISRSCARSSA